MNYKIIIPSYKRFNIFKNNTYKLLLKDGIDLDKVVVYVSTEEDEVEYKKINPKLKIVNTNCRGLTRNLKLIHEQHEEGELLVFIHDDISGFWKRKYKKKLYENKTITRKQLSEIIPLNIKSVINDVFREMGEKYSLGGVNLCSNPFMLTDNISNDLRLIEGCFYCCKNNNLWKTVSQYQHDIEMCMKFYKQDGGIVRINYISYNSLPLATEGGQDDSDTRKEKVKKQVEFFEKEYSEFGKIVKNKFEGLKFKLKRKPKL